MRIARAALETPTWVGWDAAWRPIEDPYAAFASGRAPRFVGEALDHPHLLAPCEPLVIAGIAQNGPDASSPVQAWLKSPRSVVASGTTVALRRDAGIQVAEAEIAVVIGAHAVAVPVADAPGVVLGVTAVNDLSSPDRAAHDPRNFESKGGAGFTPLGPWIETEPDLERLPYALTIDGEVVAETDAGALPVGIAECIAYASQWVPLGPGDVIMCGAPFTNAEVLPGQTVEVRVGAMSLITPTR